MCFHYRLVDNTVYASSAFFKRFFSKKSNIDLHYEITRKYPLRGCFLGPPGWPEGIFSRGGQTDADGASGAINGMKRCSVTDAHTHACTDVKVEIVV